MKSFLRRRLEDPYQILFSREEAKGIIVGVPETIDRLLTHLEKLLDKDSPKTIKPVEPEVVE